MVQEGLIHQETSLSPGEAILPIITTFLLLVSIVPL